MAKNATLLWVDLEMTGLDPNEDRILEVAAIATNWDFNEIASYEGVIRQPEELLKNRFEASKDFWDANPGVRQALSEQIAHGKVSELIEDALLKFIDDNFESDTPVLLAGNSIHQDRKFIDKWWPQLAAKLHYRMLDVSAWKVVFDGKYGKRFTKPEAHRAIADIKGSIEEIQYYLQKVDPKA